MFVCMFVVSFHFLSPVILDRVAKKSQEGHGNCSESGAMHAVRICCNVDSGVTDCFHRITFKGSKGSARIARDGALSLSALCVGYENVKDRDF